MSGAWFADETLTDPSLVTLLTHAVSIRTDDVEAKVSNREIRPITAVSDRRDEERALVDEGCDGSCAAHQQTRTLLLLPPAIT